MIAFYFISICLLSLLLDNYFICYEKPLKNLKNLAVALIRGSASASLLFLIPIKIIR